MSEEAPKEALHDEGEPEPPADFDDEADPMRALLRGAIKTAEPAPDAALLPNVQRKLRERSRGKFYGDGWSTTQQTTSYLLVAALMLLVLGVAYYVLGSVK